MPSLRLAVATAFPRDPDAPKGGVEAVSVNLVRALAEFADLEIHVITQDRAERQAQQQYLGNRVTIHRLPQRRRRVLLDAIGSGRRQMHRAIAELKPDVVHSHDVYGLMVKGVSRPRVHTIHGFIYADTAVSGQPLARARSAIWRRIETASWRDHPHIISISPYVRERLAGIVSGKIHDIENPIDSAFFDVAGATDRPVIFSAAAVCPRKNTIGLIEAFARVIGSGVEVRLQLAGAVTAEDYGRAARARAAELQVDAYIEWLGNLNGTAVREALRHATVFALVSFEENAPLGIEEALAAGVPVVTSARCGMPYLVSHGETGFLVDPNSPEDIARHLQQVLSDPQGRRRMSNAAKAAARSRFHPSVVAARTREVYLEAIDTLAPQARQTPSEI